MPRRRPQFAFTSPQANPDVERLRQEVERALQMLKGAADVDVAGLVTANEELDDLTDTVTTLATTIVTDHGALTGLTDDDHTMYLRHDGSRALTANWAVGGFDITGVDEIGAATGTFTGNVSQSSASPIFTLGDGTGSPTWLANKSDAGDAYAPLWRVANVNRWAWYFATDEDLQLLRWNAAGVFQDLTEISAADGTWSFPAAVRVGDGLEVSAGGLDVTGNIAVTGTVDSVDIQDHSARHEDGGADEISVTNLSGLLRDAQMVTVRHNSGANVGTRTRLNFIDGTNIAMTVVDDAGGGEVDITVATTGLATIAGSGSASDLSSGTVDLARLPAIVKPYAMSTTSQSVSNTTTVTDLVGATLTGGDFVAGDAIRLKLGGRYVNNSGSARTWTMILSIGGTVLWEDGSNSQGSSALYTAWEIELVIYVVSATSVRMHGALSQHTTNAPTTGLGAADSATPRMDAPIATQDAVTIPTLASNRTLTFSVQHSFAASTITIERYGYTVERLRAA